MSDLKFEVRYACERGHEQVITYGPGFRRSQVELSAFILTGGVCAWEDGEALASPLGTQPAEAQGHVCGKSIGASIRTLPGDVSVRFDRETLHLTRTNPDGGRDLTVERCEWCGFEVPPGALLVPGWECTDDVWSCPDHSALRFDAFDPTTEACAPTPRNVGVDPAFGRDTTVELELAPTPPGTCAPLTVARGHCGRCDRCGWPLAGSVKDGCTPGNCSRRPLPEKRSTCAGCGTPYEPECAPCEGRGWIALLGRRALCRACNGTKVAP